MVKIIWLLLIFIPVFPVLFFLNTGFDSGTPWKTFQTIGFSLVFSLSLIWPNTRRYFLILAGILIISIPMIFMCEARDFCFGQPVWSEVLGSSGFGLVSLLLISYVPQLIKKGYIENI